MGTSVRGITAVVDRTVFSADRMPPHPNRIQTQGIRIRVLVSLSAIPKRETTTVKTIILLLAVKMAVVVCRIDVESVDLEGVGNLRLYSDVNLK